MAKLILTEEEKKAESYLEWSDDALGKTVKSIAKRLKDKYGEKSLLTSTCATMLACEASDANAETVTFRLIGVHGGDGEEKGNWLITVQNLDIKPGDATLQ